MQLNDCTNFLCCICILNNCPEGFVTELQSEDNSVFASVDVTNGSPTEEDASRRQQIVDAAAGVSPMVIALVMCGAIAAMAACYVCFHNKKHSAAKMNAIKYKNDLEQQKMAVELTCVQTTGTNSVYTNPMKQ